MIGSIVRIGGAPADLMLVERMTPDKTQFYGTHAHGHLVSAEAKEIAIASQEDLKTWEAWEFKRKAENQLNGFVAPLTRLESVMLQPHQQRVVEEKEELDKKAAALSKFIGESAIFPTIDPEEQERLKVQNDIMWQYSEILGARISAFS